MPRKEKYEFKGVALRKKRVNIDYGRCANCFLHEHNCDDFDCFHNSKGNFNVNKTYIFVKK